MCFLLYLEEVAIVTYSYDGLVKLWPFKENRLFFSIRLPNFIHNTWDMEKIHQKRAHRNISSTTSLLESLKQRIDKIKEDTATLLKKSRGMKKDLNVSPYRPIKGSF